MDLIEGQLNDAERRLLTDAILKAAKKPQVVIEVGTWLGGGSTIHILRALEQNSEGHLWGIEADRSIYEKMIANIRAAAPEAVSRFTPLFGFSRDVIPKWLAQQRAGFQIDFVFLDGGNNPGEQINEFQLLDEYIPIGGKLMSHDAKMRKGKWLVPYLSLLDNWQVRFCDGSEVGLMWARKIAPQPSRHSRRVAKIQLCGCSVIPSRLQPRFCRRRFADLPSNCCRGESPTDFPTERTKKYYSIVMATADSADSDYYTTGEKLLLFLPCLKQRAFPKRNLFAGPYVGEFGWELMQWQGFVRARRRYYNEVHVLTYPGRDYLYEGCKVHHHAIDLKSAGYRYGVMSQGKARQMVEEKAAEIGLEDYDVFRPALLCTRYHKAIWKQDFRLFQETPLATTPYDAVFHFRSVRKKGSDIYQDYSPKAADELVERCLEHGLSVGCIGHPDYSYCPSGCEDHRSIDLQRTVAAMSSSRAVVGKNSGPMHLASLCGKPTIQWAEDQWRLDFSLRWNPFRVPIYIVSNTESQPSPQSVCDAIADALIDLGKKSNNFTKPLFTVPARRIAGY